MLVTLLLIAIHYLRIHVIGGQRLVRIAHPSLPPHHCSPTTWFLPSWLKSISKDVIWTCRAFFFCTFCLYWGPAPFVSPPSGSGAGFFMHAPLCWVFSVIPLLAGILVFLQSDVQTPSCLSILDLATAAEDTTLDCLTRGSVFLTRWILSGDSVRILRLL